MDEKRFFLDGPDGYLYYFHDEKKKNLLLVTTDGVMVWGAISCKGMVHLEILNEIQNVQKYRDLLIRVKPIIENHRWLNMGFPT
jgi:hypothetical protein